MNTDEEDALKMYVQELATVQPLTKQDEARLFREMQQEGERGELAERHLIENHVHQVLPIEERYTSSCLSMLELVLAGSGTARLESRDELANHKRPQPSRRSRLWVTSFQLFGPCRRRSRTFCSKSYDVVARLGNSYQTWKCPKRGHAVSGR